MAREPRLILAPPPEAGWSSGSARAVLAAGVGPAPGACGSGEDLYFIVMKRVGRDLSFTIVTM